MALSPIYIAGNTWQGPAERILGDIEPGGTDGGWGDAVAMAAENQVTMGSNCLLIPSTGGGIDNLLIETGIGTRFTPAQAANIHLSSGDALADSLLAANCPPENIGGVLLSHLHAAHCGGIVLNTGVWARGVLRFPHAKFFVSRAAFARAEEHPKRTQDQGLFRNDVTMALWRLHEAGRLVVIEEDASSLPELGPHIRLHHSHGHSSGVLLPQLALDSGASLLSVADLIPTPGHLNRRQAMANAAGTGYDDNPELVLRERDEILQAAALHAAGAPLHAWFFEDARTATARLVQEEDTKRWIAVDTVAPPAPGTSIRVASAANAPPRPSIDISAALQRVKVNDRDTKIRELLALPGLPLSIDTLSTTQKVTALRLMDRITRASFESSGLDWPATLDSNALPTLSEFQAQHLQIFLSLMDDIEAALDYPQIEIKLDWYNFFTDQAYTTKLWQNHSMVSGSNQETAERLQAWAEFAKHRLGWPFIAHVCQPTHEDVDAFVSATRQLTEIEETKFLPRRRNDAQRFHGILSMAALIPPRAVPLYPLIATDFVRSMDPHEDQILTMVDERMSFHDRRGNENGFMRIIAGGTEGCEKVEFPDGTFVSFALTHGQHSTVRPGQDGVCIGFYTLPNGQVVKVLGWADGMGGAFNGALGGSAFLQGVVAAASQAAFSGSPLRADTAFRLGQTALVRQAALHHAELRATFKKSAKHDSDIANAVGGVMIISGETATIACAGDAALLHVGLGLPPESTAKLLGHSAVDMGTTFSSVSNSAFWNLPHLYNVTLANRQALIAGSDGMWENVWGALYKWSFSQKPLAYTHHEIEELFSWLGRNRQTAATIARTLMQIAAATNDNPGGDFTLAPNNIFELPLVAAKDHIMALAYVHEPQSLDTTESSGQSGKQVPLLMQGATALPKFRRK